jgi:hypothetical protein
MEYSLKGLVRHRHVVFKSWHWSCGTGDLFGMSHVKKNTKLEGENTTFGWEKKTKKIKPCLYFFFFFVFFFLEIVVFCCGLWPIYYNNCVVCLSSLVMTFFILHINFFLNSSFSTLSKHSSTRILTNFRDFLVFHNIPAPRMS